MTANESRSTTPPTDFDAIVIGAGMHLGSGIT